MMVSRSLAFLPRLAASGLLAAALAGCSIGGSGTAAALAPGLSARMDQPGANLDRAGAVGLVNAYRASVGAPALGSDTGLDTTAQALASQYAATGTAPKLPAGAVAIRISAGYSNFAETFSGWRNSSADAAVLANRQAGKAGVGVAFNGASTYGTYWVLLLGN